MKIFLDTANLNEIREAVSWGAIDGVTTNPSLIAKEQGAEFFPLLREICEVVDGPVSMETTCRDAEGMIDEGRTFAKLHKHIIVKCPLTVEGLKATRRLAHAKIRVNVTLCFSPSQALLAAKAGAFYVSPFVGRLDDVSSDGMGLVADIKTIYSNYGFSTQILVASVRHPEHVVEAARLSADIATMPFMVLTQLVQHPLTDLGLDRFLKDWEQLPERAKQWKAPAQSAATSRAARTGAPRVLAARSRRTTKALDVSPGRKPVVRGSRRTPPSARIRS